MSSDDASHTALSTLTSNPSCRNAKDLFDKTMRGRESQVLPILAHKSILPTESQLLWLRGIHSSKKSINLRHEPISLQADFMNPHSNITPGLKLSRD
jgi:hypothetical protein